MNQEEALRWIAELFEEAPENIRPDTPRSDIATWDSLGVLTLMADLNERFDIIMTAEQIGGMASVADLLEVLRANGKLV
ncbi:MAG: acyl carrier protein [Limisphaerales bacterium]|jgi:acyl carrier protein